MVNKIEGVKRIRLGSLEPRIITTAFLDKLVSLEKVCPHFHLSLQSGSNATLKRMNRHYSAEEFYEKCNLIRQYYKHPAITTDVIVGFPGETDEEFSESKAFAQKVKFYEMHIFKYSKRAGTKAASMSNQLTDAEKSARSDELEEVNAICSNEFRSYYIGKEESVLFEEKKEIDGKAYWVGHTREYVLLAVLSDENLAFNIKNVKIVDFLNGKDGEYMFGQICDK